MYCTAGQVFERHLESFGGRQFPEFGYFKTTKKTVPNSAQKCLKIYLVRNGRKGCYMQKTLQQQSSGERSVKQTAKLAPAKNYRWLKRQQF